MEHPFIPSLANLSLDEIQAKMSELYKKLAFASRTGNAVLANQIRMAIESYQTAYNRKMEEMIPKPDDKDDDPFTLIDIS